MTSPWSQRNLFHFGHLVNPVIRVLLSFEEFREKYNLPRSALFGFLQIRHYALTFTSNLQFSKLSPFECLVLFGPSQKGLTSDIYKLLNSYNMNSQGKHSYMLKWEQTLGEQFSTEQWQTIWSRAAKSFICTPYKENTYKVLFFWYMTPSCLHAIYSSTLDRCWRCHKDRGMHIYWQCPSLQSYWCSVQDLLHWLFEVHIPFHPKI